jgi:hypothetical protein
MNGNRIPSEYAAMSPRTYPTLLLVIAVAGCGADVEHVRGAIAGGSSGSGGEGTSSVTAASSSTSTTGGAGGTGGGEGGGGEAGCASGRVEWARVYGGPGNETQPSVVVTTDGRIAVKTWFSGVSDVGLGPVTSPDGGAASVFVLDQAGDPQWMRTTADLGSFDGADLPDVAAAPDGGLVVSSYVYVAPSPGLGVTTVVARLAADGAVEWSKVVDPPSGITFPLSPSVAPSGADGAIAWFPGQAPQLPVPPLVTRFDGAGAEVWKAVEPTMFPSAYDLAPDGASGVAVVGTFTENPGVRPPTRKASWRASARTARSSGRGSSPVRATSRSSTSTSTARAT